MERGRIWIRVAAALAAVGGCAYAQWTIRQDPSRLDAGLWLLGAAFAVAILLGPPRRTRADGSAPTAGPVAAAPKWWLVISAAGVVTYGYAVFLLTTAWARNFDFAAPLAIAGVALWSIGLGRRYPSSPAAAWPRWEVLLFAAILAIGLFARFYRYDYYPPEGVCAVEEPQSGQTAHLILAEGIRPWEFVGDRWLAVPFFRLFGESLLALRIPYSIVSWLTLIPFYLLVRALVSRAAALFATALFAMSSWHLFYARLAHAIFPTTLIVVLVLCLCVAVHQRHGLGKYPWIGFLCGYTSFTYAGYRGTPVFAAILLAISFGGHLLAWRRARESDQAAVARRTVRTQAIGLLLAGAAFAGLIIVMQPRLQAENQNHFFEAVQRSFLDTPYYTGGLTPILQRLGERTVLTVKLFNHVGDGSETFNLPGEPMLDPVTGTLFVIALAFCVVWWRHRWQGYFAFVFLTLLLIGAILVGNFDPRRLQGIIPLIFVMIAYAADRFIELGRAILGRSASTVLLAVGATVVAVTYALNWNVFFTRAINDPRVRAAFQNRYTVAVRYLKTLPDNAYLIFVSDVSYFFGGSDYEFIRGHRIPGVVSVDLLPLFRGEPGPWDGHDVRVLMQEPFEHEAIAELLQSRFPDAKCEDATHPDRRMASMTACRIPHPDQQQLSGGIRARYYRDTETEPFLERFEPAISYAFVPVACQFPRRSKQPPCRVEWDGVLQIPAAGLYRFDFTTRAGPGRVTIDGASPAGEMQLSPGPHAVHAEAQLINDIDEAACGARLLWKKPAATRWDLVPFAAGGTQQ